MDWKLYLIIGLLVLVWFFYVALQLERQESFKWRKRWIIERFGVGVEGQGGDYFAVTSYSNGVPCIFFGRREKNLRMLPKPIRQWNHNMGPQGWPSMSDMPDEAALGLPENPLRDKRGWVAAGPGLCFLPPAVHERAEAAADAR